MNVIDEFKHRQACTETDGTRELRSRVLRTLTIAPRGAGHLIV